MKYQKLFDYMIEEHGLTLLEQDMKEICLIVNQIQQPKRELILEQSEKDILYKILFDLRKDVNELKTK